MLKINWIFIEYECIFLSVCSTFASLERNQALTLSMEIKLYQMFVKMSNFTESGADPEILKRGGRSMSAIMVGRRQKF